MNNILYLKSQFYQRKNPNKPGHANLPVGKSVKASHLIALSKQLQDILNYWESNKDINGALVSVHYYTVVAKSNRIRSFLSEKSHSPLESVRGAKFVWEKDEYGLTKQKHVFTHYISLDALRNTLHTLQDIIRIVEQVYSAEITHENLKEIGYSKWKHNKPTKNLFLKYIVDAFYVERFDIDCISDEIKDESIITIYKTVSDTKALLRKFGIDIVSAKMIDDTTLRLTPDEIQLLLNHAPYLIAMNVSDFSKLSKYNIFHATDIDSKIHIPKPTNEPIIGVIDTQFDTNVYFSDWVDYKNMLSPEIPLNPDDFFHGTAVSSIIVDPTIIQ